MKEIETWFWADGGALFLGNTIKIHPVVVGLMRVWPDMDAQVQEEFEAGQMLDELKRDHDANLRDLKELAPIPDEEGKVSVRPYVRGRPQKKQMIFDASEVVGILPEVTEAPAQLGSDVGALLDKLSRLPLVEEFLPLEPQDDYQV